MTYVTGFILVFAGMLIGYLLCYRDRSKDEQQNRVLDRENSDLRNALQTAQSSHATLEECFARQKGQLNVLQQLCDDWSTTREQSERDRAQLELEANDKRQKYESAISELQTAKQKQIELEDHVHSLNQSAIKQAAQQEKEWQNQSSHLESQLTRGQLELKSAVRENERLSKQLHGAEAKIAGLKSEIDSNQKLLETASKNVGGLKQEYVSLESSLRENSRLLASARSESAAAISERNEALSSLGQLRKQHQLLAAEADGLRVQIAQLSTTQAEAVALGQALKNNQEQLIKVTKQRDLALQAEKTSVTMTSGLQQRIDNQESTIHGLREKYKEALESAKRELNVRAELESAFERQRTQLQQQKSQLENQSFELNNRLTEQTKQIAIRTQELDSKFNLKMTALQVQLSNQTQTISDLQRARDQLTAELADAHAKRKSANDHLGRLAAELAGLQKQSAVAAEQIAALAPTNQRIAELEQAWALQAEQQQADAEQFQAQSVYVDELETELLRKDALSHELDTELTRLRGEYKSVYAAHAELQARIDNNGVSRDEFEKLEQESQAKVSRLQARLTSSEETIRSLRRERAAVLARLANYRTVSEPDATVISFKQAMEQRKQQQPKTFCDEYGGYTESHSVRGMIYTSEPESRDDLKRISGIAEVLEARLNDLGIYTFKQIMDWRPKAVEEFGRLLKFRDRIVRDDWQAQAKFFYEQKRQQLAAA